VKANDMGNTKKNILFVCTGNSCRSQMAEGFGRVLSNDEFDCKSAGTAPIGINPEAIRSMAELSIDISDQSSSFLSGEMLKWANYVITLCGSARDQCPVMPAGVRHLHWDIDNPDKEYSSDEEKVAEFRRVRDEINEKVIALFTKLKDRR
jgi:arsenate reductase